jgi:KDO2-lipid IV(A) lauroyltransferase
MAVRKVSQPEPLLGFLGTSILRISARLSLRAARAMGTCLGRLGWVLPNQFKTVSRINIDWCFPELSRRRKRAFLRRVLVATGQTTTESGPVLSWPVERARTLVTDVEGGELLDRALAKAGPGVVLLLPHLGNWEIVNPFLTARTEVVALYRRPRIAELEQIVAAARRRTGCRMVPATPTGLRELFKAVRDGQAAIILPDQEPVRTSGVFAPFFGIPALTMTLVQRLVRRFGSQALFVYGYRNPLGFTLRIREAPEGIDHLDPVVAATALNLGVERCVRECPEQYTWSYKRFKTRPPDESPRRNYRRPPPHPLP